MSLSPELTSRSKLLAAMKAVGKVAAILKSDDDSLIEPIGFSVVTEDSDPHWVRCFEVTVDRSGIKFETIEEDLARRDRYQFTWRDLVEIESAHRVIQEMNREIEELKEELRSRGEPVSLKFSHTLDVKP